jgi:hypothetical protein
MIRTMTTINEYLPGVSVGILTDAEYEAVQMTFSLAGFDAYNLPNGIIFRGPALRGKPSPVAIILEEPEPAPDQPKKKWWK